MPSACQIPRPPLSDQISEVMLVKQAYQKKATTLYLKGENTALAGKLSTTAALLGHVVDSLNRMENLEKILRQMVMECL
jgi:hypothetical protein